MYSYFIPEDGDDEVCPNVFLAPKPRQPGAPPTFSQVRDAFPLPGTYHFRFKSPLYPGADRDKGAMPVWMDIVDEREVVPTWKNTIVAKITRISPEDDDDDDDDEDFHRTPVQQQQQQPPRAPPSHQSSMQSAHSNASGDHLDIFGSGGPSPSGNNSVQSGPPSGNLFDHQTPPPNSGGGGGDLLGSGYPAGSGGGAPPAHNDFLGMTAQHPPPQQQPQQMQHQPPPQQQQQQGNAFNNFQQQNGPFGGLGTPWK